MDSFTDQPPLPPDELTIDKALELAIDHHRNGRLPDAERIYRAILQAQPKHPDANHNMGVLALGVGKADIALHFLMSALESNPNHGQYRISYIDALIKTNQLDTARRVLEQGRQLGLKGDQVENLGQRLAHPINLDYGPSLDDEQREAVPEDKLDSLARKKKGTKRIANYSGTMKHLTPSAVEIDTLIKHFNEGQYEVLKRLALKMTGAFPRYPLGWKALGVALKQLGRTLESLKPMQKAAELMPEDAEAHSNLGNVLRTLGRYEEAEASYRQAIALKPDFAEAHSNLGNALRDLGRHEEAEASCRQAITLKPDFADAHNNLGNALSDLDRHEEAEVSYRQATALKPDFAKAYSNLGNALRDLGRHEEAEACYRQAIGLQPDLSQAKAAYADCVGSMKFTRVPPAIYSMIATALSEAWGRPSTLSEVACNLLLLNPTVNKYVVPDAYKGLTCVSELFDADSFVKLGNDALLISLLTSAPVADCQLERLLTHTRLAFLNSLLRTSGEECDFASGLALFCALAQQCFINEYVFSASDEEIQKSTRLKVMLENALKCEADIPPLWVIGTACYFPLYSVEDSEALLKRNWPSEINALLIQQIKEPLEEHRLKQSISLLTQISEGVSTAVQNQYEANPYPRWVKAPKVSDPTPINLYLVQRFPYVKILPIENYRSPDILVAGCGTGQHPIQTAQLFKDARVLAIDLSASSLSYAMRKSQELGIANIEYAQADILKLASIGRTFDVIESSGVLHHLERPFDGWRLLVSLLRPNGFMKLGFYSEIARRDIVKVRQLIKHNRIGSAPSDIKKARQWLLEIDHTDSLGSAVRSSDFYTLSTCRDLLFHVQEHRMTLEQINDFIEENNLIFIGFEIPNPTVKRAYKSRFPDDRAATNLSNWFLFEQENPDVFLGMYQFWVQKQR